MLTQGSLPTYWICWPLIVAATPLITEYLASILPLPKRLIAVCTSVTIFVQATLLLPLTITLYSAEGFAFAACKRFGATYPAGSGVDAAAAGHASAPIGTQSASASANTARRLIPPVRLPERALILEPSPFESGVQPAFGSRLSEFI